MEYNTTLFGEKRAIYNFNNGVYTKLYEIPSQNISVEQGFNSGDFTMNAELPADLALWEIGEESVLTRLTWRKKDSNNNRITHHSVNNERVKMMISTNGARINNTTYDVSTTGTIYYETSQCNYRDLINQSSFNPVGVYPLWNPLVGVTGTAPHFSVSPFIMDFDYSGVLLAVYVRTANNNNYTLKEFLDNYNGNTTILAVYVIPYFGTATNHLLPSNTRFENGTTNLYLNGLHLVNSKTYDLPTDLKPDLRVYINNFIMASKLATIYTPQGSTAWTILDNSTTTTSYRVSYYQDDELWNDSGLIPHGENNEYSQTDINYILKQIAFLGFWFTTDITNIQTRVTGENCTNINTYLPEIKDGVTTGKYWSGTTAAQQDAAKWADDWREKVNYQPGGGSDENKDRGNLTTTRRNGALPTNTKNYSISANDFNALCTWCNNGFQVTDNNQFLEDFKGLNPSECIISAMYFPFALLGAVSVTQIKIGNLTAENISANKIDIRVNYGASGAPTTTSAPIKYVLNSGRPITREFNDFRDYAPYTTIDMYIPFCGSVSLNSADIYDYPLTVEIIPDLLTGSCVGCVYRGDYLLTTVDGQIGVPITLTLGQVGNYQNAITQAQFNLKNANRQMFSSWLGAVASVGALASGNVLAGTAGLIGSGLSIVNTQDNIKKAEYDLSHIPRNFNTVGSLSDSINVLTMPEYVHMIIKRPYNLAGANISQYAHTVGHACNKQGYVSDFSGYTLTSDIDLSGISATAEELEQIRKYFATGVYL